jgi:oligopeptide transport system permease protein
MAIAGAGFLVLVVAAAVCASDAPYPYYYQNFSATYASPSLAHWLGTDELGRDLFSRIVYGARVSMSVGFATTIVVLGVGVPVGLMAGYFGGAFDLLIMRLVDVVYGIPWLLLVVLLQTFFTGFLPTVHRGPLLWLSALNQRTEGVVAIVLALSLIGWLNVTRVVRGETLAVRNREYVQAARSLGASEWRIMLAHVLPNIAPTVIVMITLLIPRFVIAEAGLSFIGLGVQPPVPSWGTMIAGGIDSIESYPQQVIVPGLALATTLLSLSFIGDGLQEALGRSQEK